MSFAVVNCSACSRPHEWTTQEHAAHLHLFRNVVFALCDDCAAKLENNDEQLDDASTFDVVLRSSVGSDATLLHRQAFSDAVAFVAAFHSDPRSPALRDGFELLVVSRQPERRRPRLRQCSALEVASRCWNLCEPTYLEAISEACHARPYFATRDRLLFLVPTEQAELIADNIVCEFANVRVHVSPARVYA